MTKLRLVLPDEHMRNEIEAYRQEHIRFGENSLHGCALLDRLGFDEWLALLRDNADERTVRPDWVQATTFLAVRKSDGKLIGMIDVRHRLNDFLKGYGGNIGYGVRPTERGKGYATQMLGLALEYCRSLGLGRVMLSCNKSNAPSRSTILAWGGEFERELLYKDGNIVQVFWIELSD